MITLLLLNGYPQNHAAWIKLAVPLARNFTCVIADHDTADPRGVIQSHSVGHARSPVMAHHAEA